MILIPSNLCGGINHMESDMQINTNPTALIAANALNLATQQAMQSSQRLSTGFKVNSAADDPGSMIMLNSMKAKIASWSVANKNIASDTAAATNQTKFAEYMANIDSRSSAAESNGISLLTNSSTSTVAGVVVADTTGTFTCTSDADLSVGKKLTISGTWGGDGSITSYASPTSYLVSAISGGAGTVTGFTLVSLDGSALTTAAGTPTGLSYSTNTPLAGGTVKVQTGIEAASKTTVNLYNTTTGYLGSSSAATNFRLNLKNLNTIANAASAITEIDLAITQVASYQSAVGATQNIMTQETTLNNNLTTANTSAYSKLTSVDIAKETAKLAAAQILQDSSAAMIAQANQMNKDIVSTLLYQFTR
ncbi:MAG: hypothetical protein EBS66_09840 [Betaproteobacteria bacterium]|nr:hypothetical protein [Betaproteobacteria bacterium]